MTRDRLEWREGDIEIIRDSNKNKRVKKLNTRAPLDRSPNKNWVENAGGLPMYIRRIANHLHAEKGMDISRAIAVAVNAVKRMCSTGDLNWKGKQNVNAGSRAEACAAVTEWERKKASARVSKGITGRKLTDREMISYIVEEHVNKIQHRFTDEELDGYIKEISEIDKNFQDTDTLEEFDLEGEVSKLDTDKRIAFGWASVAKDKDGNVIYDHQGDFIEDITKMEEVAYKFNMESRDAGDMHVRKGVGTLIESMVFTPEKCKALGIPEGTLPTGWWVGFKVHDDEVWKSVKSGKYKMFSVHGKGVRKTVEVDDAEGD